MKYFLIALLLCGFSSQLSAQERQGYSIGFVTDFTGLGAYWGNHSVRGAQLAAAELKEKGVDVDIIVESTGLSPRNAVSAVHKLITSNNVDVVYSEFSATTLPISPVVKESNRIMLAVCGANSFLKSNPYSFKSYIDYSDGCEAMTRHWLKSGLKMVAVLRADTEYGDLCEIGVRRAVPDAMSVTYTPGDTVRAQMLKLKAQGIEGIVNAAFEADILNVYQAMKTLSYLPQVGTNFDAITEKMLSTVGEDKRYFSSFGYKPVSEAFTKKLSAFDGKKTTSGIEAAALSYLHTYQIVEALSQCKKADVSCQTEKLEEAKSLEGDIIGFQKFSSREAVFDVGLIHY